jgi:hypothetical protein
LSDLAKNIQNFYGHNEKSTRFFLSQACEQVLTPHSQEDAMLTSPHFMKIKGGIHYDDDGINDDDDDDDDDDDEDDPMGPKEIVSPILKGLC